jgi:hypothetical protein
VFRPVSMHAYTPFIKFILFKPTASVHIPTIRPNCRHSGSTLNSTTFFVPWPYFYLTFLLFVNDSTL